MLSFVFLIIRGPENTIADRIAAILSAFLSSLESPLSALSALEPPLNPSLCKKAKASQSNGAGKCLSRLCPQINPATHAGAAVRENALVRT